MPNERNDLECREFTGSPTAAELDEHEARYHPWLTRNNKPDAMCKGTTQLPQFKEGN